MSTDQLKVGGQEGSSTFQVVSANLTSSRSLYTVDISSVISELAVYEHLDKPYVTGYLTIVDNEKLMERFDFQGAEKFEFVFKKYGPDAKSLNRTFIIQNVEKQIKTNEFTQVVIFKIIDEEAFKSGLQNVNKAYNGQPSDIIQKILQDYIGDGQIETSVENRVQDTMKVIVPNMTPLTAMQWVKNRAINRNGYPFYLFKPAFKYTGKADYRFVDLETIIEAPVINEKLPFNDVQAPGAGTSKARELVIHKLSVPEQHDLYDMIDTGVVGSVQRYYDVSKADFELVDFNINNDVIVEAMKLNKRQQKPIIDGKLAYDEVAISEYKSRYTAHITGSKAYNNTKSFDDGTDPGDNQKKIKALAIKKLMEKAPIKVTVDAAEFINGNDHLGVGNNIRIITKAKTENVDEKIDQRMSGDYTIVAVNYAFKVGAANQANATILCTKIADLSANTITRLGKGE